MALSIQNIPSESFPTFKLNELSNRRLFVTTLYKYVDFKQSAAIQKIFEVDLIKNNYKDLTVLNYLTSIRLYLKDGTKRKSCPAYVYKIIDELITKKYPRLRPSDSDSVRILKPKNHETSLEDLKLEVSEVQVDPVNLNTAKLETKSANNVGKYEIDGIDLAEEIEKLKAKRAELMNDVQAFDKMIHALETTLYFVKSTNERKLAGKPWL